MLLAIDIGTTNLKAGLFRADGTPVAQAERPNTKTTGPAGIVVYDPEELWAAAAGMIREVTAAGAGDAESAAVRAIGITSMAESGLLLDLQSGKPRTPIIPWFEACSIPQAERILREIDAKEQFNRTGLHPSFKHGLPKLLWLKEHAPEAFDGGELKWLSVSAYIAYRLTGSAAEDETLAARTFAYRIDRREWAVPLIRHFGLEPELFPRVVPPGGAIGTVLPEAAAGLGLSRDSVVCLAGHDHVAASLACSSGGDDVYNSMGTAETLVGAFPERDLRQADYESGLSFGRHALPGRMFWMGGHSSSGGSVEWLRNMIGDDCLSYADMLQLLEQAAAGPTGIVYFPYLTGSGAPFSNPLAKAAFIGLTAKHGKGELLKAVLEGNACQLELMRERAESITGCVIERMNVVGGGAKNNIWLQIKADVSGVELTVPETGEATLLGAALSAAVGSGIYGSYEEAIQCVGRCARRKYVPDPVRHAAYKRFYKESFMALLGPISEYYEGISHHR
ncbi:xylulokinase [Paenibacillus taihuensis]|uniref:Xylulokinase n=1 Tax=Paenibacillus taihuensis TaxID=1156355 RepID=A0A3D9SCY8_9BACL|nr:FGGY family carbohydrate kinase [Paenibacillus taihuensis]REE92726.1 xylulokinase [Paenibacillus taihuensis]